MKKIQYKASNIICNSSEFYEELLIRSNEVSIHQKHLRTLATQIYKSLADINPDFMKTYFKRNVLQFTKWTCLKITINKLSVI